MPGVIENDDPGESSIHLFATPSISATDEDLDIDVEEFVDRLRFMGLDRNLVDEANRRLRGDARAGMRWLDERLKELEPPRKPPTCQCGEPLVGVEWRGRATVRCTVCGARWGVEVIDEETESLWAVSEEWRAEHPIEEYDPYGDFQPEDVLRDGLPPLPGEGIEPGSYFPVAAWQGERHGAVLYVHRRTPEEFDLRGDEYEDETEHLVVGDDGEWVSTGSGGGNWVNVFDPPADLLEKYVFLGTGITGSGDGDGDGDEEIYFMGGLCSSAVAAVETTDRRGRQRHAVDPAQPFFVVGVHGSGRVRMLHAKGQVLSTRTGEPLEFKLGD